MFDRAKLRTVVGTASAFVLSIERRGSRCDLWADAGHAIELAYRERAPIGQAVRVAVAIALVAAAKLSAVAVLG
jgi:hypothetical protein